MSVPKLSNILADIESAAVKVQQTVPIIRSTVDSVTTIASGKSPTPSPYQQPATVQELVPRNVGQLDANVAKTAIPSFLVLGGIAALVIVVFGRRR